MIDRLIEWDTDLLLWINSHNTPALDWTMWTASQVWSWAVVLLLLFGLLTLRTEPKKWWVVFMAVCFCFLLSDRISVMAFKDVFQRLRPCHVIDSLHMFRTGCGGQYGFVSSHAANVFAIATFFAMRYAISRNCQIANPAKPTTRTRCIAILGLSLWALLVCYSRPYLGKHYPGDVLCGALLGLFIGLSVHYATRWLENHRKPLH